MSRRLDPAIAATCLALIMSAAACKSREPTAPAPRETARSARGIAGGLAHTVYAASAHVRVVDIGARAVVGRLQLQRAVREIRFSADGATAYIAASDGVRAVDARTHEVLSKITDKPTRYIELSPDGDTLFALEHSVKVEADGTRSPQPFSLVSIDTRNHEVGAREVVGDRVVYAREATSGGRRLRITEDGHIHLSSPDEPWGRGVELDPAEGLPAGSPFRVRKTLAHFGDAVFVPIEGAPARVLEIDTKTGRTRFFDLRETATLRGLGVTPDGSTLLVNTGRALHFLDRATAQRVGAPLELGAAHVGCAVSDDGRAVYLARVKDGSGGAVTVVDLKARIVRKAIHLEDITPWAVAVAPSAPRSAR